MAHSFNCTSCGGEVTVATAAARVASCTYCGTTLIVNEKALRALGKMALLTETPSCLSVGWRAKCKGQEIEVLGRIQYRYQAGYWDEWWVRVIKDGSYAWISQDEGEYTLEIPLPQDLDTPDYDMTSVGDQVTFAKRKFWVEEKDEAEMVGVQGELPLDVAPSRKMRYIELTDNKNFATIEYFEDGSRQAFKGVHLGPKTLKADTEGGPSPEFKTPAGPPALPGPEKKGEAVTRASEGVRPRSLTCPSCGGTVELRDQKGTRMVVCQYCGGGIDVTVPGDAKLLFEAEERRLIPHLPMGASGKIHGATWTVIGRVRYIERDDGGVYRWDSYQIYNPDKGYAFLEQENGHWMFFRRTRKHVKPEWLAKSPGAGFRFGDNKYKVFEKGSCSIEYVEGELSWVARTGDKTSYFDAISPPYMLSAEWTPQEIEWSHGVYVPRREIAKAFGVKLDDLPRKAGVGPAEPSKEKPGHRVAKWVGMALVVALGACAAYAWFHSPANEDVLFYQEPIQSNAYLSNEGWISPPIQIPEGSHVCEVKVWGRSLNNQYVGLSVAFLDDRERVCLGTEGVVERYSGVEGGEAWREGSLADSRLVRLEGPATYLLNVFGEAGKWSRYSGDRQTNTGPPVGVRLAKAAIPARYLIYATILIALYPMYLSFKKTSFEARRWPSDD